MAAAAERENQIGELEAKLKALLKQDPHNAGDVQSVRFKLRHALSDHLLLCSDVDGSQVDDERHSLAVVERLWKLCVHRVIDEFRRALQQKETSPMRRKQLLQEYRRALNDLTQFVQSVVGKLMVKKGSEHRRRVHARLLVCLGDLARYKELASEFEDKQWTESGDWYQAATRLWPESGFAHNQLAVLLTYQPRREFITHYRYVRAIACQVPFDAAKGNLHQHLVKAVNNNNKTASAATTAPLDVLLLQALRLQALLLLPDQQEAEAVLDGQLNAVKQGFVQLQQQQQVVVLRKEVAVALVLSFAFAVDCPGALAAAAGGGKATSIKTAQVAVDAFRCVAGELVDRCSYEAIKLQQQQQPQQAASLKSLARALLYVCLVVRYCERNARALDDELKSKLDGLDLVLGSVSVVVEEEEELLLVVDEEEEAEIAGFAPFGVLKASPASADKQQASAGQLVVLRGRRVSQFVHGMLELDLKPLAVNGEVFSDVREQQHEDEEDDEEEEEIVFRPSFKAAPRAASAAAATASAAGVVVPMASLPPLLAPVVMQSTADWIAHAFPSAPTPQVHQHQQHQQQQQSRFGFAAQQQPSYYPPPPAAAPRPPPGYH